MLLIGVGVLYLAFQGQDLKRIWLEIKTANLFYVIISSLSVWFAYVLRALRWQMLYGAIHYKVNFWNVYHGVIIGYLANLALPRFGEVVRCSVMQRTEKVPIFSSLGTVITERLYDVLVLLLTSLAMLIFQYDLVFDFLDHHLYHSITNRLSQVNYIWLIAFGILLMMLGGASFYFLRRSVNKKLLRIFVSLRQGFGSYRKMKNKWSFLLYTFGIWSFYLISMYFCFSALPSTSNLHVNAAFTALVFSGFAMAAPVQGGIGVFHWMVAQSLVLYAVSFKDGLAYATIIHSSQILLILILGCLSLFLTLIKPHSKIPG